MSSRARLALSLPAVAALFGCSSDGPGPGQIPPAELTRMCGDMCSYSERCLDEPFDDCLARCDQPPTWIRGDLFEQVTGCLREIPCDQAATCDQGEGGNGEALPLPIHDQFREACDEAYASCQLDPSGYCDDADITAVNTDLMAQLIDCFDRPCAEIVSCLDDTAASQGYGF
jgi:hypothetical protein